MRILICFGNVSGNFHIVFPPLTTAERPLLQNDVMTISTKCKNNGNGRSEVYNWIKLDLLTYKQVKQILNQHLEPHLSTDYNVNQTNSPVRFGWDVSVYSH